MKNYKRLLNASVRHVALLATLLCVVIPLTTSAAQKEPYSVPDTYTPVSEWKQGFDAEAARAFRTKYQAHDYVLGNDNSAFAWLNIQEVITTSPLMRAGKVSQFVQSPNSAIADTVATTKLGTLPLKMAMADSRSRIQAIAVIHKGKLVFERYPGMPETQTHVWNSAAKTMTGLMVHMLQAQGKIDLEARLQDYLTQFKGTPVGRITISNLLHHRSGLDIIETQPNMEDPNHPLGRAMASGVSPRGVKPGESLMDVLRDIKPLRDDQGLVFDYSSLNTQILGLIIENLTGKSWNRVASEMIWSKIGAENDGIIGLSAAGDALNGGVVASTLRDFARFATIFTPSWSAVAREPFVDETYFQQVFAAADLKAFKAGGQGQRMTSDFGADSNLVGSSYKWDALFSDRDMYKAGLGGQGIYVSPETDTAVVWFSTTYRNSLSMAPYARAIVLQHYRD